MKSVKVLGSIVLYKNDPSLVINVVESFLNTELNVKLIIIDNSPSQNLQKVFNDIRISYIHNPSNPGFGASHNIAIQKSFEVDSEYHLVLNPDIYYYPGTLENLINFMDANTEVGHLMPRILYPNGQFQYLCKRNPTFFDLFARGFLPKFLNIKLKKRLENFTYIGSNFDKIIYDIPYLSGCFMLFRTSTLKNVGFFYEKIFMYLEDADITRRFLEVSRTAYFPGATVYHHYAGFTHKKLKYKLITIQSAFIYFNKWGWIRSLF